MTDYAVEIDSIWKKFRRGERHDSLRDLIPAAAKRVVKGKRSHQELREGDFWALNDVSFSVERGQALGIIGHNGAGKSTLLKVLTRLLPPTRGSYITRGRIGALIEVTAGFHSDLTGRENIFLNGAIIGMKKADIARRFDAIVEFSGIGDFIDTPVKRYSSGMNARLGFSIAAHLDPEILIVDEVLSVGDYTFQGKCVQWMQDTLKNGTTVIFVSHTMESVLSLCDTAVLMNHGSVQAYGNTVEVVNQYYRSGAGYFTGLRKDVRARTVSFTSSHDETGIVGPGERITYRHTFVADSACSLSPGLQIRAPRRLVAQTTYAKMHGEAIHLAAGDSRTVEWAFSANFPAGAYDVTHYIEDAEGGYHDYHDRALLVIVGNDPRVKSECYLGLEVEQLAAADEPRCGGSHRGGLPACTPASVDIAVW